MAKSKAWWDGVGEMTGFAALSFSCLGALWPFFGRLKEDQEFRRVLLCLVLALFSALAYFVFRYLRHRHQAQDRNQERKEQQAALDNLNCSISTLRQSLEAEKAKVTELTSKLEKAVASQERMKVEMASEIKRSISEAKRSIKSTLSECGMKIGLDSVTYVPSGFVKASGVTDLKSSERKLIQLLHEDHTDASP